MPQAYRVSEAIWGLGDAIILLVQVNRMVCIPSLSLKQLAILRLAKQYPGETVRLFYEMPIVNNGEPPTRYAAVIQKLIDFDLIEIESRYVRCDFSRAQKKSWAKFIQDLDYPSMCTWEIWRDKFIARRKKTECAAIPGEAFEDFSYVWIQEIGIQAVQPEIEGVRCRESE